MLLKAQILTGTLTKCAFNYIVCRSKTQLALFMVWEEHWYEGEVVGASVLFSTMDYNPIRRVWWWWQRRTSGTWIK